jgi:hypothetical protein
MKLKMAICPPPLEFLTYGVGEWDDDDGEDDEEPPAAVLEVGQVTQQQNDL